VPPKLRGLLGLGTIKARSPQDSRVPKVWGPLGLRVSRLRGPQGLGATKAWCPQGSGVPKLRYPIVWGPKSLGTPQIQGVPRAQGPQDSGAAIFNRTECLAKIKRLFQNSIQQTCLDHRHETVIISTPTVFLLPKPKYNRTEKIIRSIFILTLCFT
jgi:hypothetical protein